MLIGFVPASASAGLLGRSDCGSIHESSTRLAKEGEKIEVCSVHDRKVHINREHDGGEDGVKGEVWAKGLDWCKDQTKDD